MEQIESKDNSASVLVIDQACDNDQLLVSLSKNESQWLSPVGWTNQQKVTLLDCRAKDGITEVDIPSEFAKDINSGDVLVLRCSELDLEKEIIWEASEIEVRNAVEPLTASTGLASGLLSRFKTSKSEVAENIKTDAQVRAEEADRAAQAFKAKMDAATEAKERAQEKALKAAREAEAALKMEAERIAEMERAAKAFEEAERLKQDEHRRVEEERHAEEMRLAEEARKAEDIRLREIAAQKEAERLAALERHETALNATRNEEARLKKRLSDLKEQAKIEAANSTVQSDDLESRRRLLVATEKTATKRAKSLQDTISALNGSTAKLGSIQSEADSLTVARDEAVARLTQADMDYQDAQKKAEAAIALAQQRRAELDTIRAEEGAISVRLAKSSEVLSAESLLTDDLTHKTLKLREKSDLAQSELTQAKLEIEAIEKNLLLQTETTKKLELEIEATQQAVEDSQARELSYRDAIDHLELGGSPEDIVDVECETGHALISSKTAKTMSVSERRNFVSDGLMGRVRSTFARKKDAEISIETDDIVLPEPAAKTDPVLLSGVDKSPLFFRRHSSSLMALGAVLGGIAILGAGITLNTSASPKLEAKSAVAAPTQVMSAVSTASKQVIKPPVTAAVNTKKDISEDNSAQETKMSDPKAEIKFAEVVDPVGFAFELPDMRPTALGRENTVALKAKKPIKDDVDKAAPKKKSVSKPDIKKTVPEPKKVEVVNYPELTKNVQTRLTGLGFYAGEIDGLQGATTKNAIRIFRELFLLPEGDNITGALLTALKRAEREQEAALLLKQAQDAATRNVQMVEAPRPRFNSAISSEPARPIMTDTTPVASTWTAPVESAPVYTAPAVSSEPEASSNVGKIAILSTAAIVAPVVSNLRKKDVIKEASLLRSASANYPSLAQRRNYFVNVNIVVEYDIDDKGRAQNLRIASNDHDGKYKGAFGKEALKAIEKMRYKPKTVNGIATKTTGKEKRIVFRVE